MQPEKLGDDIMVFAYKCSWLLHAEKSEHYYTSQYVLMPSHMIQSLAK